MAISGKNSSQNEPWDPWAEAEKSFSQGENAPKQKNGAGFGAPKESAPSDWKEIPQEKPEPQLDLGKSYFPPQAEKPLEQPKEAPLAPHIEAEKDYFAPPRKTTPQTPWMQQLPPVSGAPKKTPFEPAHLGMKVAGKPEKLPKPKGKPSVIKEILKFVAIFIAVFAIIFVILNWPSIAVNLKYWWEQNRSGDQSTAEDIDVAVSSEDIPKDDRISINKIKVDAPIMFPKDPSDKVLLEQLKSGVVHYPGTAMPGETGNCFITGHSSNYWWIKSKYNTVFTLLPKLVVGDKVVVYYKQKKYIYEAKEIKEVSPSETNVLNPTDTPTLTLMTCVPIGTNLRRLIVKCDQISPAPGENIDLSQPRLPAD